MDKKTIGIGMLGGWQNHAKRFAQLILSNGKLEGDNFRHWKEAAYDDCNIIAAWDSDEIRGRELAKVSGCPFEPDLDAFLANPEIDAVIVCSPTVDHADHIIRAANAGKHVFVEKAPFATVEGAYLAREAVRRNGVHFMVSSPMDKPRNRFALQLAKDGKLGDITEVRFRLSNEGILEQKELTGIYNKEENGGGAMLDFGQHGVHLTSWFLGRPTRCSAHFDYISDLAKKHEVEDNVVATYEFENGGIGVVETGWVAPGHECILDVCGTKGTVHVIGDDVTYFEDGTKDVHDTITYALGGNWISVKEDQLPEKLHYPLRHWIESILHDTPDDRQNIDEAVLWTEMIAAAYRAAESGEVIL